MSATKKSTPPQKSSAGLLSKEPTHQTKIGKVELVVLGTAHVSEASVAEVERIITKWNPDTICVELCESRLKSIQDPNYLTKLDIFKVFRERKMWLVFSNLILSSFQKRLGGGKSKPGDELRRAVDLATKLGKKLQCVDREIQVTLKRAWATVGFISKSLLVSILFSSLLVKEELSSQKIEEMKTEDALKDLFSQLPSRYDSIKRVILDERDRYLAEKIRREALKLKKGKVFAVVGAGHLEGIKTYLREEQNLVELESLPQKVWTSYLGYFLVPALFFGIAGFTYYSKGMDAGNQFLISWLVVKGALAGLGAILALAHPISILLAILISPLGNFVPFLKPGWVAGLAESWLRKPLVEDFESIAQDTEEWTGYWRNRVIRIFLVFLFPQLGSTLGTVLVTWGGLHNLFQS